MGTTELTLTRLPDTIGPRHAEARQYCLDVIKDFYGFDYRPDWHADLDSLTGPVEQNQYAAANRGAFWVLSEGGEAGPIVATAAIKAMHWKPALCEKLADWYPEIDDIGSVWRVYVRAGRRGAGIGKQLNVVMEAEARRLGYTALYLHATADAADTIAFWKRSGYAPFGPAGNDIHFDKPLPARR